MFQAGSCQDPTETKSDETNAFYDFIAEGDVSVDFWGYFLP